MPHAHPGQCLPPDDPRPVKTGRQGLLSESNRGSRRSRRRCGAGTAAPSSRAAGPAEKAGRRRSCPGPGRGRLRGPRGATVSGIAGRERAALCRGPGRPRAASRVGLSPVNVRVLWSVGARLRCAARIGRRPCRARGMQVGGRGGAGREGGREQQDTSDRKGEGAGRCEMSGRGRTRGWRLRANVLEAADEKARSG